MTDFDKAEFWDGLNRLYKETVAMKEETVALKEETEALKETAQAMAETAQAHSTIVLSHERRLERAEVLIEAWLQDMRRHRLSVANVDETSKEALQLSQAVEKRLEEALEEWKRRREGSS